MKDLTNSSGKERKKGRYNPFAGMNGLLFSDDVYKRIGGFLLWGILILIICWGISGLTLERNLLHRTFLVEKLFGVKGTESFGELGVKWLGEKFSFLKWEFETAKTFNTWGNVVVVTARSFAHHLVIAFFFIFLLNRFKIGRLSLGLFFFFVYSVFSGMVVGTDSLAFPAQFDNLLGPVVTFLRYGIWVWFAYGLLAFHCQMDLVAVSHYWTPIGKEGKFWSLTKLTLDEKKSSVLVVILAGRQFAEARLIVFCYHLSKKPDLTEK